MYVADIVARARRRVLDLPTARRRFGRNGRGGAHPVAATPSHRGVWKIYMVSAEMRAELIFTRAK
jgi:hypothetical protein